MLIASRRMEHRRGRCDRVRSLRLLISGRSIKAIKYRDSTLVRSHFMSGNMRKPKGSDTGERKSIFLTSERPEIISSILEKDALINGTADTD